MYEGFRALPDSRCQWKVVSGKLDFNIRDPSVLKGVKPLPVVFSSGLYPRSECMEGGGGSKAGCTLHVAYNNSKWSRFFNIASSACVHTVQCVPTTERYSSIS